MRLRGKGKHKEPTGNETGPGGAADGGATPDAEGASESVGADAGADTRDLPAGSEPTEESAAQLRDKWLRAVAEADNARKRSRAELDEARRFGAAALLRELLPVLDNLQRALSSPPADLDSQFLQGLTLIEQQWLAALATHGIKPVPAEPGDVFDPEIHRALLEQETADQEAGHIVSEIVRCYRLHDRLLREAQVVVAKPPADDGAGTTDASAADADADAATEADTDADGDPDTGPAAGPGTGPAADPAAES